MTARFARGLASRVLLVAMVSVSTAAMAHHSAAQFDFAQTVRIEGVDVYAAYDAMADAVARCRAGSGPIFIEAMTKRWAGSAPLWPELSTGVTDIGMATGERKIADGPHRDWYEHRDPVLLLARALVAEGAEARQRVLDIDRAVSARIAKARQAAVDSPYPDKSTATDYVFAA